MKIQVTDEKVTLSHTHKLTLRVSFGRINNNAAELRATAHHGGGGGAGMSTPASTRKISDIMRQKARTRTKADKFSHSCRACSRSVRERPMATCELRRQTLRWRW